MKPHLHKDDIVIRGKKGGDTVWVSERLVVVVLDVTEEHLRTVARNRYAATVSTSRRDRDVLPDTGASWRYAKINGRFYYDLLRIPDTAPTHYRSRLGTREQLLEAQAEAMRDKKMQPLEVAITKALAGYRTTV
jgi:hypothetical protein